MLQRIPFLRGTAPWILSTSARRAATCPSSRTAGTARGWCPTSGEKKQAFFVLQRFYEELKARRSPSPPASAADSTTNTAASR